MQVWQSMILPAAVVLAASCLIVTEAQENSIPQYYSDSNSDPYPEMVMDILARIGQTLLKQNQNNKRGMDLGVGRGYSGSMAAKHLMGLASANYASGPGRRRREAPSA